jgi:GTP cyclohydrolase II
MSNNPEKIRALKNRGLDVVDRVVLKTSTAEEARQYLLTKKEKLGHF